jgi:hypothetical protein
MILSLAIANPWPQRKVAVASAFWVGKKINCKKSAEKKNILRGWGMCAAEAGGIGPVMPGFSMVKYLDAHMIRLCTRGRKLSANARC